MSHVSSYPTRRRFLAISAAMALASAARAESPVVLRGVPAVRQIEGSAFASTWRVTLPDLSGVDVLRPALDSLLSDIDRKMSPWRPDSEITAFNRAPGPKALSAETAHVVASALDIARASDGWFDPTVGPLVHRLGFGPIEGAPGRWTGLHIEDGRLSKDDPRLTMDPCGIAKGWALDRMTTALVSAGHEHFLIDLGGELAARGQHPSGRAWQVAVEDPRPERAGGAAVLRLDGVAVATSGSRAQSFDLGGRRYSHIIDPHRAQSASGSLASVSVLSESGMVADGWATALMAAGDSGPVLARQSGIAALFIFAEADGLRRVATGTVERDIL